MNRRETIIEILTRGGPMLALVVRNFLAPRPSHEELYCELVSLEADHLVKLESRLWRAA